MSYGYTKCPDCGETYVSGGPHVCKEREQRTEREALIERAWRATRDAGRVG